MESPQSPANRKQSPLALVVFFVLIGIAVGWVVRYNFRDNLIPRNFAVVDEGKLYRSGRLTPAATKSVVEANGIKTIVDLGAYEGIPTDEKLAQRTAEALGVRRITFTLDGDGTGHPMGYVEALRIIRDPANQPVLVHCAAGAQRTSVCVMLYRSLTQGASYEQSIDEAMDHKHDPKKNPRLWPYVQQWGKAIEQAVKDGGTIEASQFRAYKPPVTATLPAASPAPTPASTPATSTP